MAGDERLWNRSACDGRKGRSREGGGRNARKDGTSRKKAPLRIFRVTAVAAAAAATVASIIIVLTWTTFVTLKGLHEVDLSAPTHPSHFGASGDDDVTSKSIGGVSGEQSWDHVEDHVKDDEKGIMRNDSHQDNHQDDQPYQKQQQVKTPRLIIHVGPSKTATTTVQLDLAELMDGTLMSDNYLYFGRHSFDWSYKGRSMEPLHRIWDKKCMIDAYGTFLKKKRNKQHQQQQAQKPPATRKTRKSHPPTPKCLWETRRLLDELREDGMSLIMSDEAYSFSQRFRDSGIYNPEFFEHLRDLLEGWDVTPLATYRRVFEWFLSSTKEANAKATKGVDGKATLWPNQGGTSTIPTWGLIRLWAGDSASHYRQFGHTRTKTNKYTFIDGSILAWQPHGFTVRLLNIHRRRHITQQLLCEVIQDAPNSCRHLEQKTSGLVANNNGMAWFLYNQIVFAAAGRGLITEDMQRNQTRVSMTNELMRYHRDVLNKTLVDLPLACPTDEELKDFLNISLTVEQTWMPEWYALPEGEAAHRSAFQKTAYQERSFCNIDVDPLLAGTASWDEVLVKMRDATWV